MSQTPQPAAKKMNRRKKTRAIMASGLVLGVGAAVTLAAWSDTAWGVSQFGTGDSAFNIQASFDGGTKWDEFMTAETAGTMQFGPKATGMMPGESVYATVGLKEQHNKMDANVTLTKVNADSKALGKWITVGVSAPLATKPTTCVGVAPVKTVKLDAVNQLMNSFTLAGGATQWFCFSATLDAKTPTETPPTTTDSIQWKFDAASVEKV
ncbi:SipW-dependent-type signal peptide-containing protein [Rhodococcus sp. IEGM 1408]|uniref:SipW-dependent-type signal peptide-containing protein n=1 Tax=Rhodococcus sp. IEGM 1408 TaxID=3082220 RepID=UPI002954E135|nr:SipW-dependent-type signal peptide-containing protein [Rhodococcus sp. IEGM 1408]MDV8001455.1 SipW-dependent-type signal peptide-containing protein [Rhodococcus sp. IEGM 1408]